MGCLLCNWKRSLINDFEHACVRGSSSCWEGGFCVISWFASHSHLLCAPGLSAWLITGFVWWEATGPSSGMKMPPDVTSTWLRAPCMLIQRGKVRAWCNNTWLSFQWQKILDAILPKSMGIPENYKTTSLCHRPICFNPLTPEISLMTPKQNTLFDSQ